MNLLDWLDEKPKRNEALALLEANRADHMATALEITINHTKKHGGVTSSDVFEPMRRLDILPKNVDPRWMGAVFRRKCWKRVGYVNGGSHLRPISIWKYSDTGDQSVSYF